MVKIVTTAALAVAAIAAIASPAARAAPERAASVYELAGHPVCAVIGDKVFVRGAVARDGSRSGVPGARVELRYGSAIAYATTDSRGIYVASLPVEPGVARVEEVATWVAQVGSRARTPAPATNGAGGCVVPAVKVGRPEPVR